MKSILRNHTGILITSAIFLVAGLLSVNQVLVYTPDSARYLAWAKSLSQFDGFRDLTSPGPLKYVVHAPLYPVLLAPVAALFPYSVPAAKILTMLFGVAALVAFYTWIRRDFGTGWGVVGSILLALNPAFLLYSTQVLSDIPFVAAVVSLFALVENAGTVPDSGRWSSPALLLVGVCCIFLREVGIAVVAAAVVTLFVLRRPRLALQLILVSALFYLCWYIRNEVIVASVEHPSMRNSQIFLKHMFTPDDAGILAELAARALSNGAAYGLAVLRLPLMADIVLRNISVYSPVQFPISVVLDLMPAFYRIFLIVTFLTITAGVVAEYRRRRRFLFLTIVLAFYSIPILLYPINDTRFLLPVLVVLVYFLVAGARWIRNSALSYRVSPVFINGSGALALFILLIPNVGWEVIYVSNNCRNGRSPLEFYESIRSLPAYPELYARPFQLAGALIDRKADLAGVIVCRWKELALWTNGRRVLDTDPQATLDEFNGLLRDYRVQYVVTVYSRGGLRDYESQFARSGEFRFVTVDRIANIEIVRVFPNGEEKGAQSGGTDSAEFAGRSTFDKALQLIQEDRSQQAESLLTRLPEQFQRQVPVQMNIAIAKEFEGELDSADNILARFRGLQQAGSAVQQAWYHEQLIAALRNAGTLPRGPERADLYHRAALDLWNLGYRRQSMRFLDSAIAADHQYFPPFAFRAVCAMQIGDTLSSRRSLETARRLDPTNVFVTTLGSILDLKARLARARELRTVDSLRYEIAFRTRAIGIREESIEELLAILGQVPDDEKALRLLVDVYVEKERYEPARFYLSKLVLLKPQDESLGKELKELESRW